jgi:hypothetical protein
VTVVLDLVGGGYLEESLRCVAPGARVVLLATTGGGTATLPLGLALSRRVTIKGTVLRSRPLEEKIALASGLQRGGGCRASRAGRCGRWWTRCCRWSRCERPTERMARDETVGKIVLADYSGDGEYNDFSARRVSAVFGRPRDVNNPGYSSRWKYRRLSSSVVCEPPCTSWRRAASTANIWSMYPRPAVMRCTGLLSRMSS